MNIGEAAVESGLGAKTIRYYEDIGLIQPLRSDNGYRSFRDTDVETLKFIARARSLGFSVKEVAKLLSLYRDRSRASANVRDIARTTIDRIDRKVAELQSMRATLAHLIDKCHGDDRPDCPILDDLAGHGGAN
jgi:Cu(I)-responsive transcriptional regulator